MLTKKQLIEKYQFENPASCAKLCLEDPTELEEVFIKLFLNDHFEFSLLTRTTFLENCSLEFCEYYLSHHFSSNSLVNYKLLLRLIALGQFETIKGYIKRGIQVRFLPYIRGVSFQWLVDNYQHKISNEAMVQLSYFYDDIKKFKFYFDQIIDPDINDFIYLHEVPRINIIQYYAPILKKDKISLILLNSDDESFIFYKNLFQAFIVTGEPLPYFVSFIDKIFEDSSVGRLKTILTRYLCLVNINYSHLGQCAIEKQNLELIDFIFDRLNINFDLPLTQAYDLSYVKHLVNKKIIVFDLENVGSNISRHPIFFHGDNIKYIPVSYEICISRYSPADILKLIKRELIKNYSLKDIILQFWHHHANLQEFMDLKYLYPNDFKTVLEETNFTEYYANNNPYQVLILNELRELCNLS